MLRVVFALFMIAHGLVHLLYSAQSRRLFELQPGMVWPDGSWAFSRLLGEGSTRTLASIACILAALAFVGGGAAVFARQGWWRPVVIAASVLSSAIFLLCWNGGLQKLSDQGVIAILINAAILVAVLLFHWPALGF